jgi:hypothetical protein
MMKNTSPAVVFVDVFVSKHRRLAVVIVPGGFPWRRCSTILHAGLPEACSCTMPLMARYLQTQLQKCRQKSMPEEIKRRERGAVLCSTKEKGAESGGLLNGAWSGAAAVRGSGRRQHSRPAFADIDRPEEVSNLPSRDPGHGAVE